MRRSDVLIIMIFNLSTENLISITTDMEPKSITMEILEHEITNGTLDYDITTAITPRWNPNWRNEGAYITKKF